MASAADVRAVSLTNEFAAYTDEQIEVFLGDAANFLDKTVWGTRYQRALTLLAAHLLLDAAAATSSLGGLPPAVTWESIGGASRSYAAPAQGSTSGVFAHLRLHATPYGRLVAAMLETIVLSPIVVFDNTKMPVGGWDYG